MVAGCYGDVDSAGQKFHGLLPPFANCARQYLLPRGVEYYHDVFRTVV